MKIIVTGAAGFIGSHVVDRLIAEKHTVFGIDNLVGGFKRNIHKKSNFIKLDLVNKNKTIETIQKIKPQLIYHLAADATEGRSQFTPISASNNNYLAHIHLLTGLVKAKVKKIVVVSSMSVYGNQKTPFSEEMIPQPVDMYGISKYAMEEATKVLAKVYGFDYAILRPHNVYGPRQNISDPYRNVIGIFINCLLNEKRFYIYGNGEQKRAFSYIDDIVPCIVKAGLIQKTNSEIINIGPQKEYSINYIAKLILQTFFQNSQIPKKYTPIFLPDRPQEVKDAFCTDLKARELLNFKPTTSIEKGIEMMISWAKKLGPQKFIYLENLELTSKDVPKTWSKKLL